VVLRVLRTSTSGAKLHRKNNFFKSHPQGDVQPLFPSLLFQVRLSPSAAFSATYNEAAPVVMTVERAFWTCR
jgi:hypothetical protein